MRLVIPHISHRTGAVCPVYRHTHTGRHIQGVRLLLTSLGGYIQGVYLLLASLGGYNRE